MENFQGVVTMDTKQIYYVKGKTVQDVFMRIDGLRLQGKRWLEVFEMIDEMPQSVYVNIDHIVSIE